VSQLAAAQLHALERLSLSGEDALQPCTGFVRNGGMAACVDLAPLFSSMPLLSFVSLRAFAFVDFSVFKLLSHLTALREITWPKAAMLYRLPYGHLVECLPSLKTLHVRFDESPSAYPWRIQLSSLPALRSVSWRREKACPPGQIGANFLAQAETRAQMAQVSDVKVGAVLAQARAMYEASMAPLQKPSPTAAAQDGVGVSVEEGMDATGARLRREWEEQQRALGRSTAVPDLASLSLTASPAPTVVSSSDAVAATSPRKSGSHSADDEEDESESVPSTSNPDEVSALESEFVAPMPVQSVPSFVLGCTLNSSSSNSQPAGGGSKLKSRASGGERGRRSGGSARPFAAAPVSGVSSSSLSSSSSSSSVRVDDALGSAACFASNFTAAQPSDLFAASISAPAAAAPSFAFHFPSASSNQGSKGTATTAFGSVSFGSIPAAAISASAAASRFGFGNNNAASPAAPFICSDAGTSAPSDAASSSSL
jgi:hypothetical protein